jgi:photosystem II stability/assembly factor-like uncharacterized protein
MVGVAALAATVPTAGAVVSSGHSGWSWSNPSPQGENIADISFSGGTGYAVGGFGTLLRSTDAGTTWSGLPSTTVQDLTRVGTAGANGFVTSGNCAVRRSTDAGTTLSPIDVGGGDTGCGSTVQAVAFADASNGLVLFQSGVVLGTADGGATLSRRTPVPGSPTDLVAISPTTAFATSNNAIYRTVDSGGSWTLVAQTPSPPPSFGVPPGSPGRTLRSLAFPTADVGYAAGDGGTVMKTIDGGANWTPATSPGSGLDLTGVRCADASLCLFTTASGASIVRTPDGGATYTQVTAAASPLRAVAFASATRAIASGDSGVTVLSDDGGVTWRTISASIAGDIGGITAGSAGFAYAVGSTAISLTSDGGGTWRSVGIPTPRAIAVAAFADPLTGYVQDDGGTLRRTTNGGTSWQILDPGPVTGTLQDIVTLGSGKVLLVTTNGIGRSVNGGDSFGVVSSPVLKRSKVIRRGILSATGSGTHAFVASRAGLLISADAGATWKQPALPKVGSRAPTVAQADCIAPSTCWVLTTGSRLYRTANLGARWTEVTPAVGVPLRNVLRIAAAGPREAFLALRQAPLASDQQGVVLHTSDGGNTWAPQLVGRNLIGPLDAVAGRAWALSDIQIFTTTTGGRTAVPSTLTIAASKRIIRARTSVTIRGRLKGAQGGEQVALYVAGAKPRVLTVASSGTFTVTLSLRKTTTMVAQWAGDGVRSGDGTPVLVVTRK